MYGSLYERQKKTKNALTHQSLSKKAVVCEQSCLSFEGKCLSERDGWFWIEGFLARG